jgi:putative Holliday junction resolvase
MGKILALDYGKRRIGVAISDPDQTVAFPREVWEVDSIEWVINQLKNIISEENVEMVIVGHPLSLSGKETAQTRENNDFIEKITGLGVPIERMDERWSTVQAERSGGDDAVAAQILLSTYLDRKAKTG